MVQSLCYIIMYLDCKLFWASVKRIDNDDDDNDDDDK